MILGPGDSGARAGPAWPARAFIRASRSPIARQTTLPDRITIYRREICAIYQTEQEVAGQVRRTVIHEIAHHFGIDDHRLSELGW